MKSQALEDEFLEKEFARRRTADRVLMNTLNTWLDKNSTSTNSAGLSLPNESKARTDNSVVPYHLAGVGYDEVDPMVALRKALEQTIAMTEIRSGDSVYLRVNSNSGDPYPYSTSPKVIVAVGQMLRDLGVNDLRIGDRSFWGDEDTAGNLRANGIAAAAKELNTTALVFDDSVEWVELQLDSLPNWRGPIRIPKSVATATHFINLACLKTHFIAHVTLSLKLVLGLIHAQDRKRGGNLDTHIPDRLWPQIAQVNKQITPTLNILDGFKAVVTGGPTIHDRPAGAPANWHPQTANPGVFIVSTDRIATDVLGAAVLQTISPEFEEVTKHEPFSLPQIKAAIAAGGLGIAGPDALDVVGPSVPSLDEYRRRAMAS
jgi:uncharacterized protein (DUF362 family)